MWYQRNASFLVKIILQLSKIGSSYKIWEFIS